MQVCLPAGCIDAVRVAVIDDCSDLPICGDTSGYIFNCFRNLELTTNIEDGEETILRNDCGKKCFSTRTCDELTNIGLSFELLNPDYELTNLLTGQSLINDGLENIGWYHTDGRICPPWLSVELFEQVPDEQCAPGHRYRRIVLPKTRFRPVPSPTREGTMRVVGFEGVTSEASIAAWGTGPFDDSPFDFSGIGSAKTHIMEFFDSSITDTLEGQCGFIPVCSSGGDGIFAQWTGEGELTIVAPDLTGDGSGPFCPAPDEVTITFEDNSTATIPLPDATVTIIGCNSIQISDMGTHNPSDLDVIGVTVLSSGDPVAVFDAGEGLAEGEYEPIPMSSQFFDETFPGEDTSSGVIPFAGTGGCGSARFIYNCFNDTIRGLFYPYGIYDGTVQRTEVVTELGTFNVSVINEQQYNKTYYPFGSSMQIEDASTYGLEWEAIRVYDADDNFLCEWTGLASGGGTSINWSLQSGLCSVPGEPVIEGVDVEEINP